MRRFWQSVTELLAAAGAALFGALEQCFAAVYQLYDCHFRADGVGGFSGIGTVFGKALGAAADTAAGIVSALHGLCEFLLGAFTGDWRMERRA